MNKLLVLCGLLHITDIKPHHGQMQFLISSGVLVSLLLMTISVKALRNIAQAMFLTAKADTGFSTYLASCLVKSKILDTISPLSHKRERKMIAQFRQLWAP